MSQLLTEPSSAAVAKPSSGYVSALDPLRGAAALAVAFFHFTHNGWLPHDHWLAQLAYQGHHGVQTFLVLSGFVVPYAMLRGDYSVRSVLPFLGRRITRIYPPYIVSALILGVLNQMTPADNPHRLAIGDLACHFVFLNDLLGRPWLMEVYWTLALELQFYLFAGLLWPLLVTRNSWLFAAFAIGCATLGIYFPNNGWLIAKISYFLLGIALFRQHAKLDKPGVSALFLIAAASLIGWRDGTPSFIAAILPLVAKFTIQSVPAPARFLGTISYSLYLFHLLSGGILLSALTPYVSSTFWRCMILPVAIAVSIAAAWVAYSWLEAPGIAWSRRFRYHGPDPQHSP